MSPASAPTLVATTARSRGPCTIDLMTHEFCAVAAERSQCLRAGIARGRLKLEIPSPPSRPGRRSQGADLRPQTATSADKQDTKATGLSGRSSEEHLLYLLRHTTMPEPHHATWTHDFPARAAVPQRMTRPACGALQKRERERDTDVAARSAQ